MNTALQNNTIATEFLAQTQKSMLSYALGEGLVMDRRGKVGNDPTYIMKQGYLDIRSTGRHLIQFNRPVPHWNLTLEVEGGSIHGNNETAFSGVINQGNIIQCAGYPAGTRNGVLYVTNNTNVITINYEFDRLFIGGNSRFAPDLANASGKFLVIGYTRFDQIEPNITRKVDVVIDQRGNIRTALFDEQLALDDRISIELINNYSQSMVNRITGVAGIDVTDHMDFHFKKLYQKASKKVVDFYNTKNGKSYPDLDATLLATRDLKRFKQMFGGN